MNALKRTMVVVAALALVAGTAFGQYTLGEMVNLGSPINSEASEGSPSISSDGLELYFHSNRPGGRGGMDLYVSRRASVNAPWGAPVNLGPNVNSPANEIAPTISADGLELYFSDFMALREGGAGDADLWVSRRASRTAAWGPAENLGAPVNTEHAEITPELSRNGLELYFETSRPGSVGTDDIFVARRASLSSPWQAPVSTGRRINTEQLEHCPTITADGLTLFFDYTDLGTGVGDLMVTTRPSLIGAWSHPISLGHEESDHFAACIATDGKTLYFTSEKAGGMGGADIWMLTVLEDGEALSGR